jgi:phosphatidylserine decarboxylase
MLVAPSTAPPTLIVSLLFPSGSRSLAFPAFSACSLSCCCCRRCCCCFSLSLSGNRQRDKYLQPSSRAEILPFIDFHQLSVDEIRDPLHSFANFNEFFYRHLKAGARPLAAPLDDHVAVQPADCRLHVFPHVDLAKQLWIKGEQFSIPNLLWSEEEGALYEGGSLVIARLAPQDYHRYHFPVSGIMVCEVITGVGFSCGLACMLLVCVLLNSLELFSLEL